jgi:hypothetical protein
LLATSCQTTVVKIDPIESFEDKYYDISKDATEEEVYEHAIIIGKKEINYLRKYIEILINRIKTADKKRIRVIDLREEAKKLRER